MGTHPIFESDFDCLTEFNEMTDELKKIKVEDKECEMKILEDKIIWNETTPNIINNAKNVLRKCHENRHVMRYALFAARAQIYRRIDDICNAFTNGRQKILDGVRPSGNPIATIQINTNLRKLRNQFLCNSLLRFDPV